ncbi:MAG: hypothetical protein HQL49_03430 [Gammaproteobacteria bacterium]|nr:hypothetical protein [Gammaproteobacteria bacterium]
MQKTQPISASSSSGEGLLKRVTRVIASASGLLKAGERDDYLHRCVADFMVVRGEKVLETLLQKAERGEHEAIQALRNALAVNYTYFWREPEHFHILMEHVIISLRKRVDKRGSLQPRVHLWSAGCASGEEPWSMAIAAAEACRVTGLAATIEILATDIDTVALADAQQGRYRDHALRELPNELRERYFHPLRMGSGKIWRVGEALRKMVRYVPNDLLAAQWPVGESGHRFDAIFCRNVMIYLSDSARVHLFEKFSTLLTPDGLLLLSRVEGGMSYADAYFRPCGDAVYLPSAAARRVSQNRI